MLEKDARFTVAYGDGIGPEIMTATLKIMEAAMPGLQYDVIDIGEKVYLQGHSTGISPKSWETLRKNKILLKAPITTPSGGGYKSLNVTIRKSLGLYANVRPTRAIHPFVKTNHPATNLVIVRENEEDLYAGIEYQQSDEVVHCIKLVSRPGSENIIRYAFEYARQNGRERVTCMAKDNIMKLSDGLFHRIFDEVAAEYPEIQTDFLIIDIGSARIADSPERFDVIVTLNLYGDIISDIASQVTGSVGMGGSSNVGDDFAMFEAIHGSAPDIAGRNIANPSGLLNGAIMMLQHLGKGVEAHTIECAWLKTLEDGYHTAEIFREGTSKKLVGTIEFADAIIERLGQKPSFLIPATTTASKGQLTIKRKPRIPAHKVLKGIDVFIEYTDNERNAEFFGKKIEALETANLKLKMISNRGVRVYPNGLPETFASDQWRCRFLTPSDGVEFSALLELQQSLSATGFDVIKTENLYAFDGVDAYSLGQGE